MAVRYEAPIRARLRERPGLTIWTPLKNGFGGLLITVSDDAIEVGALGPIRRLAKFKSLGLHRVFKPSDTTMSEVSLGAFNSPLFAKDWIVLTRRKNGTKVIQLAIRPTDGDLERLRVALRGAGASET